MTAMIQRGLTPFAFSVTLMLSFILAMPELRNPLVVGLSGATALLILMRPIEREMRSNLQFRRRVLLLGHGAVARKLIVEIENHPDRGYTIIGIVHESPGDSVSRSSHLVLGTLADVDTIVAAVKPDVIAMALTDRRGRMPVENLLAFQAAGIVVEDVEDVYERVSGKLLIETVTAGHLIASQRFRKSRWLKMSQRAISFTVALLLLTLFAPLLALIAIAVKLDSRGAILFRHMRLGQGDRPFELLKFRTMRSVERPASEWVEDNRGRITALGKWLRRFRLDELPQLVNVIRGDMNLVGPRPHPMTNLQLFRSSIPYYRLRASVRPGITGWAQVRYHYANNLEEETEKMRYDLYYIKHMSLWMDLEIIFRTFIVFVRSFRRSPEVRVNAVRKPLFVPGPARLVIRRRDGQAHGGRAPYSSPSLVRHDSL